MRSRTTSLALLAALWLAPASGQAQVVQGQVYVQPPPGQGATTPPGYGQPAQGQPPVYGQARPVYVQPPAPEPRQEQRVHVGLIVTGAVMLAVSWIVHGLLISPFAGCSYSLFGSSSGCAYEWDTFRWSGLVPIIGPWIQLGVKPTGIGTDGWGPYLIIDGILQAGGLTMLILGATITETVTVYGDNGGPSLAFGAAPGGLRLSGTF